MTKSQEFPSGLFTMNSFFLITDGTSSAQAIIYNKYIHILKKKNSGSIVLWFTHSSGRASGESAKSNMRDNPLW